MAAMLTSFVDAACLTDVTLVGEGLEFLVYQAKSIEFGHGGDIALRIPKHDVFANANDPYIDAPKLLQQELAIYAFLGSTQLPVPRPHKLLEVGGKTAMIAEFVACDGSIPGADELGSLMALLHSLPPPLELNTVAGEGGDALDVLPRRVVRRWAELQNLTSVISAGFSILELQDIARHLRRFPSCILHMDWRPANLRMQKGKIAAVVDWSNALIGPAVIDIYRALELESPGTAFLVAYNSVVPVPKVSATEELFLRLDAAVMLTLVFLSESPDPVAAIARVDRVRELGLRLREELSNNI